MKQSNIVIRVEDDLKEAFTRLAVSQDMSVSQMLRKYMRQATGYVTAPLPDPTYPRKSGDEIQLPRNKRDKTMSPDSWLNEAAKYVGAKLHGDMTIIEAARQLQMKPEPYLLERIQRAFDAFGFASREEFGETVYTVEMD